MNVRSTIGVLLACSLAVVPLGAQGHSGGPHGNPHTQGAAPQAATHTPQGPKSPNPGAGHGKAPVTERVPVRGRRRAIPKALTGR